MSTVNIALPIVICLFGFSCPVGGLLVGHRNFNISAWSSPSGDAVDALIGTNSSSFHDYGSRGDLMYTQVLSTQAGQFALAGHHRSGTHLIKQLADLLHTSGTRHAANVRRVVVLDKAQYLTLKASGPLKLVHIIRDPLELVVSAYWYHTTSSDGAPMSPKMLKLMNTQAGLGVEALHELRGNLKNMEETIEVSSADPEVLTVGLENFHDDFNRTLRCIYGFLFEVGQDNPQLQGFIHRAQIADTTRWSHKETEQINKDMGMEFPISIGSEANKEKAKSLIASSINPVWNVVRGLRPKFGYREVSAGKFRTPFSSHC